MLPGHLYNEKLADCKRFLAGKSILKDTPLISTSAEEEWSAKDNGS